MIRLIVLLSFVNVIHSVEVYSESKGSFFYECCEYVKKRERDSIISNGIKIFWIEANFPMDLRKKSLLDNLKEILDKSGTDSKKVFSKIDVNHWLLATCEFVKNNGARGLKREWKGDVPGNINAAIFIPVSFSNNDAELLRLQLHRAVSMAIYNVLKANLRKYSSGKADRIKLKWINDVIIDDKKVCGIKPDDFATDPNMVCYQFGVNINMSQEELDKIDQPATSLSVECGKTFDHNEITKEILIELINVLKMYKNDLEGLDKAFSDRMAFIGEEVIVFDAIPGKNVEGILEEVKGGRLFIRTGDGEQARIEPGYGILRKKASL